MKPKISDPYTKLTETTKLLDFWQWAYSDLMNESNRTIFAEFIVGTALGCLNETRIYFILNYSCLLYKGKSIKVISQTYKQSDIIFFIGTKMSYDPITDTYPNVAKRNSYIHVLGFLDEKDKSKVNPLNIKQWRFIVVPTSYLDDNFDDHKSSVRLSWLMKHCNKISYSDIKNEIDYIIKHPTSQLLFSKLH